MDTVTARQGFGAFHSEMARVALIESMRAFGSVEQKRLQNTAVLHQQDSERCYSKARELMGIEE